MQQVNFSERVAALHARLGAAPIFMETRVENTGTHRAEIYLGYLRRRRGFISSFGEIPRALTRWGRRGRRKPTERGEIFLLSLRAWFTSHFMGIMINESEDDSAFCRLLLQIAPNLVSNTFSRYLNENIGKLE